jgi:hypothetical protein
MTQLQFPGSANEPSSNSGREAVGEHFAIVAVAYMLTHAAIWLACFVVGAAISKVSRAEFIEAAMPLDPLSLRYMRFANAVGAIPPILLFGLASGLFTIDLAVVYVLGGRSRIAQVTRMLWATAMTAIPFIVLVWAFFSLDLPFRGIALSHFKTMEDYRQVESHVRSQLAGTWIVTQLKRAGEAAPAPQPPVTITFSTVKAGYPVLHAESSEQRFLLSGDATVSYRGNGVCLHLNGAERAGGAVGANKQTCLIPKEPGDRMVLWVAQPDSGADDHSPTEEVTVVTLVRRKVP